MTNRLRGVALVALAFTACSTEQAAADATLPATVPIVTFYEPLAISASPPPPPSEASRVDPPAPPPSPVDIVNNLPYSLGQLDPAVHAFHWVTASRGWSLADIAAWTPFVRLVMARESGGCWNVRRGARFAYNDGSGCVLSRQGRYSDSGFGQVLMSIHAKWLCPQEGICSAADVVSSPWVSMTAFVALIERSGKQPWCFTPKLRRGYACRIAP